MSAEEYEKARRQLAADQKAAVSSTPVVQMNLDDWDGDPSPRRLRLIDRSLVIDCFATPSRVKKLNVFLSAGGGQIKDGIIPSFQRVGWHPWFDGVNVNIADPTYSAYPNKLYTGWYLGNEHQDAVLSVRDVIRRIQTRLDISNENVVIIGSSAGGTSALKLANIIPGSTAIAENPPVYPHQRTSAKAFSSIGIDLEEKKFADRTNLSGIFTNKASRFFIIQNAFDGGVVKQLQELFKSEGLKFPGVGLSTVGAVTLYLASIPARSSHDTFLSETEFRSVHAVLGRTVPPADRAAAFDAAFESLRQRIHLQDRLASLRIWTRIVSELNAPQLSTPVPSDGVSYTLPLRDAPSIGYRLRLNYNLKSAYISVPVGRNSTPLALNHIRQVAETSGSDLVLNGSEPTLRISNTPIAQVASRLEEFVAATSHLFAQ